MTWYRTGTAAFTNGNATVTGTGTAWIANASIGEALVAPDGRIYEITAIASDTSLTISPAYLGSTASGQAYAVAPIRGRIAQLLSETSSLLSSFATVRDGIGAGLFPNGTVSAPALRASADQDTGLFFPAANSLAVATGGTERIRIDSSGNVGVGTTGQSQRLDAAIASGTEGAGLGVTNLLAGGYGSGINFYSYRTDGTTKLVSGAIRMFGQANWADATNTSSGMGFYTVGNNTLGERMRIDANGNVGIGTNAPVAYSGYSTLTIQNTSGGVINLRNGGATAEAEIAVTSAETYISAVSALPLTFKTTNTERMRITGAGVVRPGADNTQSFGEASYRWSTVFAGTGTINTSDEREKVWRGAMTEAEMRAAKRLLGELGMFQFTDSVEEKGEDARQHFGVRAQRAFAILEEEGLEWWRYAWCCHDKWDEITEPVTEEVTVEKTRTVSREQTDDETGETVMVEIEETYEETEQRDTGEVRVVREAGDRYGIRADQLAYWLIAAQSEIQADLDARLAALEGQQA